MDTPTKEKDLDFQPASLPQLTRTNVSEDGSTEHESTIKGVIDIPWKYRIIAFCLILVWGTGASFADVTIGPLKSKLRKELKINSESTPWV